MPSRVVPQLWVEISHLSSELFVFGRVVGGEYLRGNFVVSHHQCFLMHEPLFTAAVGLAVESECHWEPVGKSSCGLPSSWKVSTSR